MSRRVLASCPGVTAYRLCGMVKERVTLPCLGHDEQGNHLVRDPDTNGLRWVQR